MVCALRCVPCIVSMCIRQNCLLETQIWYQTSYQVLFLRPPSGQNPNFALWCKAMCMQPNVKSPLSLSLSLQAVLCTWAWWRGHSSGEEWLTKWAADNASSFVCPQMASLPSCRLLSRDTASSSCAVSSPASGKSDEAGVVRGPLRTVRPQFKWFVKALSNGSQKQLRLAI